VSSPTRSAGALSETARAIIDYAAHVAVTNPGKGDLIPSNRAELDYYRAAVKRITLQRARRQPLPCEYNLSTPDVRSAPQTREAAPRTSGQITRPREHRERRHVSRSTTSSDPGDDPPGRPPRGDGAARLLRRLAVGLDPSALRGAAELVVVLDEDAIAFPSLEEARREHLEAKARRWS
jgi:hypothetical protein